MREMISLLLLLTGAVFVFIAALGVVRMPDMFLRMSAASKAGSLGASLALLAAALYFYDLAIAIRVIATIAFIFLTTPVAAHLITRAAYVNDVPLWEKTICNELGGRYDRETHRLASSSTQQQN
ncbi:MAG: monovalent cation/H(+) antiporter subunit G [Anaerolineales bacterium]|nr:monovalent cation/H(+) antiporter subunit G [Anaerolineales bacterium]